MVPAMDSRTHGWPRLRRLVFCPAGATAIIAALSAAAVGLGITAGAPGWSMAWLMLGLCAGYALSGSA